MFVSAAIPAHGHCDTIEGPVVRAARRALDSGDVSQALRWVRAEDEAEVRQAFTVARNARTAGAEAKDLADLHFFEVVVRLHRAGEGEPYTGLKDVPPEPAIVAADQALETGDVSVLTQGVSSARADAIRERFARVLQARNHADESLAAGREYVRSYVEYIHYVDPSTERDQGPEHVAPHPPSVDRNLEDAKVTIDQFAAAKTRLRKKESTKLTLAFRSVADGEHVSWRLTCSGVAITGWDAPQLLSVSERVEGGTIRAIEARDFIVTKKPVVVVVKRFATPQPETPARCTLRLAGGEVGAEKSIDFN